MNAVCLVRVTSHKNDAEHTIYSKDLVCTQMRTKKVCPPSESL